MNLITIEGDIFDFVTNNKKCIGIAHQINCFNTQKKGFALQMSNKFNTHLFKMESDKFKGDIRKLGNIDFQEKFYLNKKIHVINSYGQYRYGTDKRYTDYNALVLCIKKINHIFKNGIVAVPYLIGCGLAGGDEKIVKKIISDYSGKIQFVALKKV